MSSPAQPSTLQLLVLRLISALLAIGFLLAGLLGTFQPEWIRVASLALALLCVVFTAWLMGAHRNQLLIRGSVLTLMTGVFLLGLTIQPRPLGTLSGFVFLGFAVAVASYEGFRSAVALSGVAVVFGALSILFRSSQPWGGTGVFLSVALIALVAVFGFRRAAASMTAEAVADSLRDPLTGLTNRRGMSVGTGLLSALAERSQQRLGCLIIDLDRFKLVNDGYGHDAGDRVLVAVSNTIRDSSRQGDLLVRLGGEEFALFTVVPGPHELAAIAERVRAAVEDLEVSPRVTASVGGALNDPGAPVVVEELLRQADRQLYAAKEAGRNLVQLA